MLLMLYLTVSEVDMEGRNVYVLKINDSERAVISQLLDEFDKCPIDLSIENQFAILNAIYTKCNGIGREFADKFFIDFVK